VLGPQRSSWHVGQGKLTDVDWRSNSGSFAILTAIRQLRYYCTFSLSGDPNLKGRQMAAFSLLSVLFKIATAPAAWRYSLRSADPSSGF
jgi:hypothetical protein